MRRLAATILALGMFAQVGSAAAAAPSRRSSDDLFAQLATRKVALSVEDARALRDQIEVIRALTRTAPVQHTAGDAAAADTLKLLEALERAVVVVPGESDRNACVITFVNRVVNTFQSIYYYWIHYPFFGLAEVQSGAEEMVRCLVQR